MNINMDKAEKAYRLRQEGYTYQQIAEELGIGLSTVHKYVRRVEAQRKDQQSSSEGGIENYIDRQEKLKTASVDDVVNVINESVTEVPEETDTKHRAKAEAEGDEGEKSVRRIHPAVLIAILTIIAFVAGIFYFFHRKAKTNRAQDDKKGRKGESRDKGTGRGEGSKVKVNPYNVYFKVR